MATKDQFQFSQGQKQTLAILDSNGHFFIQPQTCKDYLHDSLTAYLYPDYSALWSIWYPEIPPKDAKRPTINMDRVHFVLFCGKKSREKNALKFKTLIGEFEDRIGLQDKTDILIPESGVSKDSGPFVAIAPNFWVRSPVLVSAYCTFLRLSIRMFTDENWDQFIERMKDKKEQNNKDAGFLRLAIKNGNLQGILERRLPCMHREGYSDYLLNEHSRTFAWYHSKSDALFPMDEAGLKTLRIEGKTASMCRDEDVA